MTTEWLSCALAHRVFAVSHSMRRVALDEGLCGAEKIAVLAGGSGNGVDATRRFVPQPAHVRREARARLGIPEAALVIGFVGRIVRDKGVVELAVAWNALRDADPRLRLLLVGRFDTEDAIPGHVLDALRADPRVHLAGVDPETPPLYAAMDVVALPTYREGFPNVALEAAAMELPIVATSVTGCVDAVVDGTTGILVPTGDAAALERALRRYLVDPALCRSHGAAARARVLASFRRETIWNALAAEYVSLLESASACQARTASRLRSPRSREGVAARGGGSLERALKRVADAVGAALLLTLSAPLFLVGALAIALEDGRPVLFVQERVGRHRRPFRLLKLRTMRANRLDPARDEEVRPDNGLVLRTGALLRRFKIDELPQLWNVLVGDMSLVGPRPMVPQQALRCDAFQARRFEVRPGLSGWAQVNGNTRLNWAERVCLDVWYVDHSHLLLDVAILVATVRVVLSGEERRTSALEAAVLHARRTGWSR
jgi:lipopolysaccharide/colanic/teichoic acid biosynthesis glycosyltransferase